MTRTDGERLAVIEEILLRVESKIDAHMEDDARRFTKLERAWAYATGVFTTITTLLLIYFKVSRP
jgi:hypothetical protein